MSSTRRNFLVDDAAHAAARTRADAAGETMTDVVNRAIAEYGRLSRCPTCGQTMPADTTGE